MRVLARDVDMSACPVELRVYLGQSLVSVGREYEVHALAVFERQVFVQIVDDAGLPNWRPFWLFEVSEASTSADWVCRPFHDKPQLIIGPEFVAKDHASYRSMVELDAEQVRLFWERLETQRLDT